VALRRKDPQLSAEHGSVRLNLHDVGTIVTLLTDSDGNPPKIEADEYVGDSVEDLKQIDRGFVRRLRITRGFTSVWVTGGFTPVNVSAGEPDPHALLLKLNNVILPRRVRPFGLPIPLEVLWAITGFITLIAGFAAIPLLPTELSGWKFLVLDGAFVCLAFGCIFGGIAIVARSPVLYLGDRRFVRRYAPEIAAVGVGAAVVAAVVGVILLATT
jgi:hypothetical protein